MRRIRIKKVLYCRGNAVHLCKCTDAKQTDTRSEKREDLCQPSPFLSHAVLNIIERPAKNMAVSVNHTVLNRKKSFRIFGCHSQKCRNYHPEQCSRSSSRQSRSNTSNISGSDRGGQRRAQRSETGHFPVAFFFIFHHEFQCFSEMLYL